MVGDFHSSVSNQKGRVLCKREIFEVAPDDSAATKQQLESEIERSNPKRLSQP